MEGVWDLKINPRANKHRVVIAMILMCDTVLIKQIDNLIKTLRAKDPDKLDPKTQDLIEKNLI